MYTAYLSSQSFIVGLEVSESLQGAARPLAGAGSGKYLTYLICQLLRQRHQLEISLSSSFSDILLIILNLQILAQFPNFLLYLSLVSIGNGSFNMPREILVHKGVGVFPVQK